MGLIKRYKDNKIQSNTTKGIKSITDSPDLVDVGHKELAAGRTELTRANGELKEDNHIFFTYLCDIFLCFPLLLNEAGHILTNEFVRGRFFPFLLANTLNGEYSGKFSVDM